jgi:hypothetical protein
MSNSLRLVYDEVIADPDDPRGWRPRTMAMDEQRDPEPAMREKLKQIRCAARLGKGPKDRTAHSS